MDNFSIEKLTADINELYEMIRNSELSDEDKGEMLGKLDQIYNDLTIQGVNDISIPEGLNL